MLIFGYADREFSLGVFSEAEYELIFEVNFVQLRDFIRGWSSFRASGGLVTRDPVLFGILVPEHLDERKSQISS